MTVPGRTREVAGPEQTPPPLNLLTMALKGTEDESWWGGGAAFRPNSCGGDVTGWVMCPGSPQSKPQGTPRNVVNIDTFIAVGPSTCSTFHRKEYADYASEAVKVLEACKHKLVEREFWMGELVTANTHLSTDAGLTKLGGVYRPSDALALLEQGLVDRSCGGRGMIHARRKVITQWMTDNLVRREGGYLLTPFDTIVVPGAGYPGTGPAGEVPSYGSEWVYATGMVKHWAGEILMVPNNLEEALDRATNTVTVRAEQPFLLAFDPCVRLGVRVDTYVGS